MFWAKQTLGAGYNELNLKVVFQRLSGDSDTFCFYISASTAGYLVLINSLIDEKLASGNDPMDCSLPGSSVHGIFQTRVPEWVAISFSRRSSERGSPALFSSVQFSSVAQSCTTLCDPMNCSTAGLPAAAAAAAAKSLQSCLTLCNPIDGSPPGSAVPRILQAGKLEWITISFSNV